MKEMKVKMMEMKMNIGMMELVGLWNSTDHGYATQQVVKEMLKIAGYLMAKMLLEGTQINEIYNY